MPKIASSTTRKALVLLVWPIAQLFLLRVYLHSALGLRFGFHYTTDFDFIIPAPTAFIILMQALERAKPCRLSLVKATLLLNLVAACLFLLINQNYDSVTMLSPTGFVVLWFGLILTIFLSGFCMFVPPSYYLRNPNRFAIIPCLLIASSLFFYMNGFQSAWRVFGNATSEVIHRLFILFPVKDITASFSPEDRVTISHPLLLARIGKGCGGLDSLFFFTLLFLLMEMLQEQTRSWLFRLKIFFFGIIWMFSLNILRIVGLIFVGIWLKQTIRPDLAIEIFKLLFHLNVGWILYSVGMYYFFKYWSYSLKSPKDKSPAVTRRIAAENAVASKFFPAALRLQAQ